MKKWVSRDDFPPQPKSGELLADICAPKKLKSAFLEESVKNLRFSQSSFASEQIEDLFFGYAEKGKCAFAEIGRFPDLPKRRLLQSAAGEKSLVNRQNDFGKRNVEKFVLKQLARPPTIAPKSLFKTSAVRELRFVSRRIQPRAPPAFIA